MIFTTIKYHLRFNQNKKFMELVNADFSKTINAEILDEKLNGLKWISPYYIEDPNYEINLLNQIKNIIISDKSNKIIVSDYQILPAITNTRLFAPNKWFDLLSVPDKKNEYFFIYKNFFIKKLKEQKVQTIYLVGQGQMNFLNQFLDKKDCLKVEHFNEISKRIRINGCY